MKCWSAKVQHYIVDEYHRCILFQTMYINISEMLWICLIINSGSKIVYLCIFSSCRKTCCGSAQQLNKSKSDEGFIYDKSVKDQNTLLTNHFEIMKWYVVSPWKILWIVTHGNNKAQIHTKIVLWTNNIFVKKNPNTNIVRRVIESRFYG